MLFFASLSIETLRKLKRTWYSESLMGQYKSEGKDSKRDYAKEKIKKTRDSVSLRKEILKNRKEGRF
jgi:hypothetical protein